MSIIHKIYTADQTKDNAEKEQLILITELQQQNSSLYSLQSMVLIDLFGIDRLVTSYGVINLSFGVGSLMAGPATSALSVLVDDADFPFYTAGVMMALGAVSLGFTKCSCKRLKSTPQSDLESSDLSAIFVISHTPTIGAPAA